MRRSGIQQQPVSHKTNAIRLVGAGPIDIREIQMAVPKRKVTRMKRGNRRAHDALKQPTYVEDKDSGDLKRPHHINLKTGKYRGRQVLEPQEEV